MPPYYIEGPFIEGIGCVYGGGRHVYGEDRGYNGGVNDR